MFQGATGFNGDVSKWDVSSVSNMNKMFWNAQSFDQDLCGVHWVLSRATKTGMFANSLGSIASEVCTRPRREMCSSQTVPYISGGFLANRKLSEKEKSSK